jgi:hypothetical protein
VIHFRKEMVRATETLNVPKKSKKSRPPRRTSSIIRVERKRVKSKINRRMISSSRKT